MPAPRATHRLQLHTGFTFADAVAAVPYLAELGVSHLYLSPVLQAAPGSTHGYDVVDPDRRRRAGGSDLVTVVPRLGVRAEAWRDTTLALGDGRWRDALTGRDVAGGVQPVAGLWRSLPIALLVRAAA